MPEEYFDVQTSRYFHMPYTEFEKREDKMYLRNLAIAIITARREARAHLRGRDMDLPDDFL